MLFRSGPLIDVNKFDSMQIGLASSDKISKRLMREVFRMHQAKLKKGYHIVWVARQKLTKADLKTFERVFLRLVKRAALLQE